MFLMQPIFGNGRPGRCAARSVLRPSFGAAACVAVVIGMSAATPAQSADEGPARAAAEATPAAQVEKTADAGAAGGEQLSAEELFAARVLPLLQAKCFACHGPNADTREAELDLSRRDSMLRGGSSGAKVLVPGNANASLLYVAVTWQRDDLQMPPKENDRLTQEQTWWIRDWIDAGAPWPSEDRIRQLAESVRRRERSGVRVVTSGGLDASWDQRVYRPEDLWAYQPLRAPRVPLEFLPDDPMAGPVDAFIGRGLDRLGLSAAPRADRRTLIRRATFDLWGLPPSPQDVEAFVRDPRDDAVAFAAVVDRLLAGPHYGEQWGRHWLDVVRYADTAGLANDYERPNAWRYRDYVIRAFNRDKPYDRFIKEQVAGDELYPGDVEALIATGFLRMGPWEQTGMSVFRITRQQFLHDVTNIVGEVFLSHPLQCARCHDHKFDPIPTRDHYRIQAVFATTQFAERPAPFLPEENTTGFDRERQYLQHRIQRYQRILQQIYRKRDEAAKRWYAERGLPFAPRQELLKRGVPQDQIAPRHIGLTARDLGMERIARKYLVRHRWEMDRYEPVAFAVYSGATPKLTNVSARLEMPRDPLRGELEQTAILALGNPFSPIEPVTPGVLSCLPGSNDKVEPNDWNTIPTTPLGRRAAFARWLADERNVLVVRSIVNRVWLWHFGRGIVDTPNNFGATGKKPTQPELLDWLAVDFVRHGWSLKHLHRRIMLSATYCRAGSHPDMRRVLQRDPEGTSYAFFRPRRLTAEELRDAMLCVSGDLNREMGGVPVRPDINPEVARQPRQIMGTYAPAYQPSPSPAQRHRRSVYAMVIRGLRDPFMEVFNQPNPDLSCERRDTSTVTPQVFTLFNSEQSYDRAIAFAEHVLAEAASDADAIVRVWRLALQREPSSDELRDALNHWAEATRRHERMRFVPQPIPTRIVRQAVDENTGETFEFVEELEQMADYVPDRKPWQVDPRTRGLADVCLVLMNANEFVYVE